MTRRRLQWLLLGSVALAACLVAACADIFGVHSAELGDGSAGDSGLDVGYDYALYDKVPIDVNTAVCDGGIPVLPADQAYWVSAKIGSDGAACGTQASPCKTINHLLSVMTGGLHAIYLDDSVFHEQLDIGTALRGFTIQGGFIVDTDAGTWTPTCANNLTYISPEDGGPATISITNLLDAGLTLRLMQVETKVNGNLGESVYAVLVVNSDVLLDNVNLYAQNGGPGRVGGNGASPPTTACDTTGGGTGASGTTADAGATGTFTTTPAGFVPDYASNGTSGDRGAWTTGNGTVQCGSCVTGCN